MNAGEKITLVVSSDILLQGATCSIKVTPPSGGTATTYPVTVGSVDLTVQGKTYLANHYATLDLTGTEFPTGGKYTVQLNANFGVFPVRKANIVTLTVGNSL
jgi:hypothetical protein